MKIRALQFYKNDPRKVKDRWQTFYYVDLFPVRKYFALKYLRNRIKYNEWRIKNNERKIAKWQSR